MKNLRQKTKSIHLKDTNSNSNLQIQNKPPPIVIENTNTIELINKLTKTTPYNKFIIKNITNKKTNILTENSEQYTALVNNLNNLNVQYYTYTPKWLKPRTVILKGLHADTTEDDVLRDLKNLNFESIKFIKLKNFKTKNQNIKVFIVQVSADSNVQTLQNVKTLNYQIIKWESLKKIPISRCRNFQRLRHIASNCSMQFRYCKCTGIQPPGKCPIATEKVQYINYNNIGHLSSYKGCPAYVKELTNITSTSNKAALKKAHSYADAAQQQHPYSHQQEVNSQPAAPPNKLILSQNSKEMRPHLAKKKVLFHHDNAPSHTSAIATAKLVELCYELLPHPPYSPDLAPSDYFLFPSMKTWLGGKRFSSNEEIMATNEYFEEFDKSYFLEGLKKIEYRWNKCIELGGDYIEK